MELGRLKKNGSISDIINTLDDMEEEQQLRDVSSEESRDLSPNFLHAEDAIEANKVDINKQKLIAVYSISSNTMNKEKARKDIQKRIYKSIGKK
ncbi:hypothetical protein CEXT_561701 [Caerostris extrusa]|uniref:Uncharacterized protein n=1 Tax=Caerostris extrusa TaxID=172846 RepID=A0AAV4RX30_CAEEX|nr:hypothetical protein CEXT_561701 [Caerostris extrusa]